MDTPSPGLRRDVLLAAALASALGLAWTVRDWADLSALRLPDTDDVMRLQQIRDWLGGQAWSDLAQHRLGGGIAMHWSRLADLVPGGLIAALSPSLGRHGAEVAAVVAWPLALFAVAILLVARIGRIVGGAPLAATAAVVAAIAYPATTVFAPGRIDHHGLQMVLLLGAVLALVRPPSEGAGFAAGLLGAAGLIVGLETAPLIGALGALAAGEWIATGDRRRLRGLGIGALAGLAVGRGLFSPTAWSIAACDGFTATAWHAELPLAAVPLLLSWLPLSTCRDRLAVAIWAGAAATAAALWLSPACLRPYGGVDPRLARLWLARVGEAQPLFAAPAGIALGYAGVTVAGIAATLWRLQVERTRGWLTLAVLLLAALAVTWVQLRGAYAGALLAAPGLAAAIAAARARGALSLAAAWGASAGMLYPIAAEALTPVSSQPETGGDCASPALAARLAGLPVGTVIAPIDAGAWLIAATPQRLVAGPYHRNGAGNLAMFAFYLAGPAQATRIARGWHATYAISCAAMPGRERSGTAASRLAHEALPGWRTVAMLPDGARIDAAP